MKTYLINLDKNHARLESSKRQLNAIGISFQRIRAVPGRELSKDEKRKRYRYLRALMVLGRPLNDGEIGCALSHLSVYRDMIANGVETALVLEDDMVLKPGFVDAIKDIERFVDKGKPQVYFLASQGEKSNGDEFLTRIIPVPSASFADAYVITLPAAELVSKANFPVKTQADVWTRWHRRLGVELYRRLPFVAFQDNLTFGTDIRPSVSRKNIVCLLGWKAWRVFGVTLDWLLWKVGL